MKLLAFNIQNYRSIINSQWSYLANDNITTLIGQNESGKTSVLEALYSFYTGFIHDDVMRSDQSLPSVQCQFLVEDNHPLDYLDKSKLPQEALELLEDKTVITLTRNWLLDKSFSLQIGDSDLQELYTQLSQDNKQIESNTLKELEESIKKSDELFTALKIAEENLDNTKKALQSEQKNCELKKKHLKKEKDPANKVQLEHEVSQLEQTIKDLKAKIEKLHSEFSKLKKDTESISEKMSLGNRVIEARKNYIHAIKEMETIENELDERTKQYELTSIEKQRRKVYTWVEQTKNKKQLAKEQVAKSEKAYYQNLYTAYGILAGKELATAEYEAIKKIHTDNNIYSLEELGREVFQHVPVFEFFEDFSSLLPNKIDLEDIVSRNQKVEGYKAVLNFLAIAGLDPNFFIEKNNRILKQKIENLNSEITINFQDYWSQHIGKKDKIRLNFELEHYDYTIPEKKGKPYLEFWIKDQNERLYPKQRSRGVRWFLSFYLELKATATSNHANRVLLIDEPGLSLHAKAQEDVLKVFEDLKESMQIIYCTHSPHLVNVDKLYRVLAVQRADENNERSESTIIDAKSLHAASNDTLSPIYSLMGIRLGEQQFVSNNNNVIIEDSISYHYLNILQKLVNPSVEVSFIPSSGITNIPVMANILTGWKLQYKVLLFNNDMSESVATELKRTLFLGENGSDRILYWKDIQYIEDLFSTIDFKKYILNERVGITEKNSEYIEQHGLSRNLLAANFVSMVYDNKFTLNDLDKESQQNITRLVKYVTNNI